MTAEPVVLPLLWASMVVIGGWRRRPAPVRVRSLIAAGARATGRHTPVMRLGRFVRGVAGRPADAAADRRAGAGSVLVVVGALVSPWVALVIGLGIVVWACVAARRREQRADALVVAAMPETIDLFVLAAGAGHPVPRALQMVSARAGGRIGDELRGAAQRVRHGERTADALDAVAATLGEPVRPLVGVLCTSERYGTPLVPALERLAAEARLGRRRRAEESARRVPVKLLFPLVLCTLPAFALLTVVPLLVGAFDSLRL